MSTIDSGQLGLEGFHWFIGVVEDRQDPEKRNRVKVRIIGHHTEDKTLIPTEALPWALTMSPLSGSDVLNIHEGHYVMGFYLDGSYGQRPCIIGMIPGVPGSRIPSDTGFSDPRTSSQLQTAPRPPLSLAQTTTGDPIDITEADSASAYPLVLGEPNLSRLGRNDKITDTIIQQKKDTTISSVPTVNGKTFSEPPSPYAAVYPYNHVTETESGHVIELDDTPGAERVHIYHRSGTSDEIHPDGTKVSRVNGPRIEISLVDHNICVFGDYQLTVKKDLNVHVLGNYNLQVAGQTSIKSTGPIRMQSGSEMTLWSGAIMALQGAPLIFNAGIPFPLGPPEVPIVKSTAATLTPPSELERAVAVEESVVTTTPPVSDPTEPGNVALKERVGARLTEADPTVIGPEAIVPTNLPPPPDTAPQTVLTSLEGADIMVKALNAAAIKDATQRAMIWGQCAHESQNFTKLVEDVNYSKKGLLTSWSKYFVDDPASPYDTSKFLGKPDLILNRVYAGKVGNSKDETVGDGYKYRGRGFIQLTGKGNYVAASKAVGLDLVNNPDAASQAAIAAKLVIWYFREYSGGYKGAYGDIVQVTEYVNGKRNGLEDRDRRYHIGLEKPVVTIYSTTLV